MNLISSGLAVALLLYSVSAYASVPPAAPNFCTFAICLEISQLSSNEVKVETQTNGVHSRIVVKAAKGTTILTYSLAGKERCVGSDRLNLKKIGGKLRGNACVALPNERSVSRRVFIEYAPVPPSSGQLDDIKFSFPVLHLWSIDTGPVTFWESGYALRLGEGVPVTFSK